LGADRLRKALVRAWKTSLGLATELLELLEAVVPALWA
jgi:hypothetical protein